VNVQTLENHPEMQYIIVCIYIYMHGISRHALSQTCIYMYMHGISHSGRGSGFQMMLRAGRRPAASRTHYSVLQNTELVVHKTSLSDASSK